MESQPPKIMKRSSYLVSGQRYRNWTVIEFANYSSQGHDLWLCKCNCGNTKTIEGSFIRTGTSNNCSQCVKYEGKAKTEEGEKERRRKISKLVSVNWKENRGEDLIGKRFFKLLVVGPEEPNEKKKGKRLWKCICDCGIIKIASTEDLRVLKSCGCSQSGYHLFGRPEAAKKHADKLREIAIKRFTSEGNKNRFKQTVYTKKGGKVLCLSSWEVVYCKYLDWRSDILKFEKDKVRIWYPFRGKQRVYVIDFLITYSDKKQELVEVKPKERIKEEINQAKFKAAESWCLDKSINFIVVTQNELSLISNLKTGEIYGNSSYGRN